MVKRETEGEMLVRQIVSKEYPHLMYKGDKIRFLKESGGRTLFGEEFKIAVGDVFVITDIDLLRGAYTVLPEKDMRMINMMILLDDQLRTRTDRWECIVREES